MTNLTGEDLDTAPCGYITFSDAGTIINLNKTLLSILGYGEKSELIGKKIETIFTIATRIFYQTHFFPILKMHGKAEEIFFSLKCKANNSLPFICNTNRKEENNIYTNHCILFQAVQREKYEQEILLAKKQAEDALAQNQAILAAKKELEIHALELDRKLSQVKQMNEDLIQFGKLISHDLQEPVRKIAIFAEKVATENTGILKDASVLELMKINKEGQKLRRMVYRLEKFITLNLKTETLAKLDLNKLVNNVVEEVISSTGITEVVFETERLQIIDGYKSQIEVLFYNIIHNCFMYRDELKPLVIKLETSLIQQNIFKEVKDKYKYVDFIQVNITDNGRGFNSKTKNDIFLIGKKIDGQSIGLSFGLAFCNKIVENHYGSITIDSINGAGTKVKILLPINQ